MIPLNTLGDDEFARVVEQSEFASLGRGERLVEQGDRDCFNIYLLKGSVSLLFDGREVDRISAHDATARFPIAHQVPRKYAVRANTRVEIVRVDNRLLGELLLKKGDTSYKVEEFDSRGRDDWMSQLLRLPAFQQVPAANMQSIMLRMEEVPVKKGDTVIREGDAGDFFYLIHQGRCRVSKRFLGDKPEPVAELGPGESFGEEALLSDKPRGSSVSMLTDGVLVRLAKADFLQFVRQPVTRVLRAAEAEAAVQEGAVWLDVRSPKAYERGHLPGSINLPLPVLRYQASSLDPEAVYVVCCEDGHASYTAAFLLRERGFDARVLQGGLASLPAMAGGRPMEQETPAGDAAEALDAEALAATVIELRGALSSSNASAETLKGENLAYRREQGAMRERMAALESQLAEHSKLREALEAASAQVAELRARIANDAQEGEALRRELEGKLESAKAALETRLRESEERADRLEREELSLRTQLAERATRLETLEKEAALVGERHRQETVEHGERVRGLEEALSQANRRAETLSADLATLSGQHGELSGENTALEKHLATLRSELEAARDRAAAREAEFQEGLEAGQRALKAAEAARAGTEQSLARLRDEAGRAGEEAEQGRKRQAELEAALESAFEERRALSRTLEARDELVHSLEERLTAATGAVSAREQSLSDEVDALRRTLSEETARAEGAERQRVEALERELAEARQANGRLRDQAQSEAARLAGRLDEQEQAHGTALAEQAAGAEKRLAALRAQLDEAGRERHQETETLRQRLVELEGRLARSTADLTRRAEEAEAAAKTERAAARSRRAEAENERAAHAVELDRLESQLAAVNEEAAILRSTASELHQRLDAGPERPDEGEATALREELRLVREQAMSETARLESESLELQEALSKADRRIESAREERALLKESLAAGQERFAELQAHFESAKQLAEEQKRALRSRGSRIAGLEQQVTQLQEAQQRAGRHRETEANELRGALDQAETRARNLEKSLEQAERSHAAREKEITRLRILLHNREALPTTEEAPPGPPLSSRLGRLSAATLALALAVTAATPFLWPDSPPGTWLRENLVSRFQNAVDPSPGPAGVTEFAPGGTPPAAPNDAVAPAVAKTPGAPPNDSPEAPVTRQFQTLKERLRNGLTGPEMVRIDGGAFLMGDPRSLLALEEQPAHEVRLKGFYIGRHEVTFDDYRPFAAATGRRLPDDDGWGRGSRPVINVRWSDAAAYAEWLSRQTGQRYRLPSEAEWEYAARAGTQTTYWWGYAPERNRANCFDCGSEWDGRSTAPVGSFEPNPFGLHDTAGNVMEWVADCFHPDYEGAPADGTPWVEAACSQRMIRGGAFNKPAVTMKNSKRLWNEEKARFSNLGFRLVRELE